MTLKEDCPLPIAIEDMKLGCNSGGAAGGIFATSRVQLAAETDRPRDQHGGGEQVDCRHAQNGDQKGDAGEQVLTPGTPYPPSTNATN